MKILRDKYGKVVWPRTLESVCVIGILLFALPVDATDLPIPWECTGFAGKAQSRCVRTFHELKQEKTAKLERKLEIQQQTVQHLQQLVTQQKLARVERERQLTQHHSPFSGISSVELYPPYGFSLRLGRDRWNGESVWYGMPRYFGSRWYGHGHRRWYRH